MPTFDSTFQSIDQTLVTVDSTALATIEYCPTQDGYLNFIRKVADISADYLPATNPTIYTSYQIALACVSDVIALASGQLYTWAVYCLGVDRLVNFAMDAPDQTFFWDLREKFRLDEPRVGVSSQVSDQGTAVGLLNPDQMKRFTLRDLQILRTPYGREYMGIAQMFGDELWGLT